MKETRQIWGLNHNNELCYVTHYTIQDVAWFPRKAKWMVMPGEPEMTEQNARQAAVKYGGCPVEIIN